LDPLELVRIQVTQTRREPRRAARADGAEHVVALARNGQPDAAAVTALVARALDEPGLDQALDVAGHPRGRHALALGELADPDPRAVPDLHEQRDLPCRDADRVQLASQLAVDLEHDRPERVRQ